MSCRFASNASPLLRRELRGRVFGIGCNYSTFSGGNIFKKIKNARIVTPFISELHPVLDRRIASRILTIRQPKILLCSRFSSEPLVKKTIFALASGHGKCGVAVVRISGPDAQSVIKCMVPEKFRTKIKDKQAFLSPIKDPVSKELIDHGLILWFSGPNSFTGEDVCELQVHGGPAVISALYAALAKLEGLRLAEAGEFSKRAFFNGKLDLTEVEGLGDLIQAETEAQRQQAVRQMSGDLSKLYDRWRHKLLKTVAHVEAFIDFSEDENIEEGVLDRARQQVVELLSEVKGHLSDSRRGERLRGGVHVAIAGRPNVGKSTLLNALCQRPAAIVSPIAGTTRDVVESTLNIAGYPVILSDTAGIRESADEIEMEGVRRARERTSLADLTVFMVDGTSLDANISRDTLLDQISLQVKESRLWEETNDISDSMGQIDSVASKDSLNSDFSEKRELIVVINKTDLLDNEVRRTLSTAVRTCSDVCGSVEEDHIARRMVVLQMSCKTESGLDDFLELFSKRLANMCSNPASSDPYLTQERHRNHLTECARCLSSFGCREDLVMAAEELRQALRQLGKITGHVTTEDVLDVIFKDFCIGK